ncbi:MAG: hypothetical protein OEZ10_11385 [Gammaproteobacteria bacterium]|nr:hypothetical protein [Gammaproteobacteria bacterium]
MKKVMMFLAMGGLLAAGSAMAANKSNVDVKPDAFSASRLYFGAGPSQNRLKENPFDIWEDEALGYEVFAGYDLGMGFDQFKLMVEAGIFNSGTFENTVFIAGIPVYPDLEIRSNWAAAVIDYSPVKNLDLMLRLGYGQGDQGARGRFGGVGVGYWFHKNIGARLTYTDRDDVESVSLNIMYRP